MGKTVLKYLLPAALLAIVLTSCGEFTGYSSQGTVLARVGRKELRSGEAVKALPAGLSAADSVAFIDKYVNRWIVRQLKLEEASLLFSASERDIEAMVEEYRQSLLMRKIDQYYVDCELETEFSDEAVEAYYNAHRNDFLFDRTFVQGRIVKFPASFRQASTLLTLMRSPSAARQKDFDDLCAKNRFMLTSFQQEWVPFSDFLSYLPTERSQNYDGLLAKSEVQQMSGGSFRYYFQITAVRREGSPMPLDMVRDKIIRILRTQRQGEIIRSHEDEMYRNAVDNGHARIFVRRDAQPDDNNAIN